MPENASQPQAPMPPSAAPQPPQAPQPGAPNPYGQPKKNTGLIIGIVLGIIVLLGGGVALALTLSNSDDKKNGDSSQERDDDENKSDESDEAADEDKLRAANAKTASSMTDLKAVCEIGSVTNAADLQKPYKVAAFSKEDTARDYWSQVSLKYDAPYYVKYDEYAKVNAVVCLTEDSDARVKAKTCDFKSGGENVSIDLYATKYEAVAYEAKSGKKIEELGTVSGPASRCPSFVSYDKSDPKIIAKPDSDALDALVAKFAS